MLKTIDLSEFLTYDDQQLWHEIKEGNKLAFDVLMERHWKPMFESAFKMVQSIDVSQDLVQEVFLHIWLKRDSLDIQVPQAYLKTATRFRVYTYFSRHKMPGEFTELFESITDPSIRTENAVLYADIKKLVRAWIDTLPQKRREIFILYLEDQLTTREISEKLQISQKTVQNQLNRSIGSLRDTVSKHLSVLLTICLQ